MSTKQVTGTREWAVHSRNIYKGCSHDCRYCYTKAMAVRLHTRTADNWQIMELNTRVYDKTVRKVTGRIMFPTTHDITPDTLGFCLTYILRLVAVGNDILIVTKPHYRCVAEIYHALISYRDQIVFRFTIGSADDTVLQIWEPDAPSYAERIKALRYACTMGYKTSVSCEPMLDYSIHRVVEDTRQYVNDSIWLGVMNNAAHRLVLNGNEHMIPMLTTVPQEVNTEYLMNIYKQFKDIRLIKWKDSIKKVVGISPPPSSGLDI